LKKKIKNLIPIRYFYDKQPVMVIFPKAKINIGLRITEKRQDGYHNLQTIFYPVNLCDALEFVVPEDKLKGDVLTVTGITPFLKPEENLVIKALSAIRHYCQVPFLKIHLHKIIPTGAGLGGGSSDAASFLKILNRYFYFQLSDDKLREMALSLGSDCPFFIDGKPVYAEGRGEIMTPVDRLPDGLFLVILKPEINISTREAFAGCFPYKTETTPAELLREDITKWKNLIFNDFEKTILEKHPEIGEIKKTLYKSGALYSSMTGSGSAVYGIFNNKPMIPVSLRRYLIYSGIL
jgi:4-diphosphocytidyl-2-C-methyl-D-erythritol kinase